MSINDASRIIIDDSRVMHQIVASLTDDSRGIIYDRNGIIYNHNGIIYNRNVLQYRLHI